MKNQNELTKTIQELRKIAKDFADRAYSPYSQVKVGAAILSSKGKTYGGCNIENSSYGGTVCAEQVAILKAISEGEKKINLVYIYTREGWPPCGICRQMMSEFASSGLKIIIGDITGKESLLDFKKEILPLAFTPKHLK